MDAKEAQTRLAHLFKTRFGENNVYSEWRSDKDAQDWLRSNIYKPRPDIAVGPFNIQEGPNSSEINNVFDEHDFFRQIEGEGAFSLNSNPRCLIAVEIENSNKGKYMIGNIVNASILGKVGIVVTLRQDFYDSAKRTHGYLKGAFEKKWTGCNPSN